MYLDSSIGENLLSRGAGVAFHPTVSGHWSVDFAIFSPQKPMLSPHHVVPPQFWDKSSLTPHQVYTRILFGIDLMLARTAWLGYRRPPNSVYRDQIASVCGEAAGLDMLELFSELEQFPVPGMIMKHWAPRTYVGRATGKHLMAINGRWMLPRELNRSHRSKDVGTWTIESVSWSLASVIWKRFKLSVVLR